MSLYSYKCPWLLNWFSVKCQLCWFCCMCAIFSTTTRDFHFFCISLHFMMIIIVFQFLGFASFPIFALSIDGMYKLNIGVITKRNLTLEPTWNVHNCNIEILWASLTNTFLGNERWNIWIYSLIYSVAYWSYFISLVWSFALYFMVNVNGTVLHAFKFKKPFCKIVRCI